MNTSSTSQMEVCGACWGIPLTHFTAFSTAELMMAEAVGLVNTLDNWRVVDKIILSTKTPEKKRIFGKGNFQSLTGIIHPVSVNLWVSECVWIWLIICFLSFPPGQRKSGKQQESPLFLWMSSVCLLSLRWAHLKIAPSLHTEWFCVPTAIFFHPYRGSWRRPGGLKSLTDTQWSSTFSVATPGLRRPSYRFLWQRSPC